MQYILTVLEVMLSEKPSLARAFHAQLNKTNGESDPFSPFMKLLARNSVNVLEKAVHVLTELLSGHYEAGVSPAADETFEFHLSTFAEWVVLILKAVNPLDVSDSLKVSIALSAMQRLCSTAWGRAAAINAEGLVVLTLCGVDICALSLPPIMPAFVPCPPFAT